MKRWLYIGGGVLLGLLIVIAIALYYVFSSLNSIVKAAVEKYGSDMTQAVVKLNDVEIELTSGKGALRGLTVGNPSGFKSERALRLGEVSLQLDVGSVTKDPIVIKEIAITAPEVTYEFGLKGSNVDALKRNVNAYAAQGKDATKAPKSPAEDDKPGKKLVVEHLYIRNGTVHVSATELAGKTATTSLADIHLTDIGKKTGGATSAELAEQDIGGLMDKAKGGAAGVSGAAEEATKGGPETLKGLFGK